MSSPSLRDTRGAALVEYVTALAIALLIAAAITRAHQGALMPRDAEHREAWPRACP